MSGLSLQNFAYPIANVIVPQDGPKTVGATADFSNTGSIDIDGQNIIDTHAMEFIQGVFVDNSANAVAFTLLTNTGHKIVVGPNMQGFYPLLVQNPPRMTATMAQANGRTVGLMFYNVPIMSGSWKTV